MGAGIAQVCLVAGHAVRLYDASPEASRRRPGAHRGRARAPGGQGQAGADGARGGQRAADARSSDLADVAEGADVVIEAAVEDLAAKQAIFEELDRVAPPEALLATNTSALSVTAIAEATTRPGRVVGLHFFNPAPLMRAGRGRRRRADARLRRSMRRCASPKGWARTPSPAATRRASSSTASIGPSRSRRCGCSRPVRRTWRPSTPRCVAGGYPMGPFALIDLVGIDVNLAVARTLYEGFEEAERFRPSALQERMVEAGTLGRKTGQGFYRYDEVGGLVGPAAGLRGRRRRADAAIEPTRSARGSSWPPSTRPIAPPARASPRRPTSTSPWCSGPATPSAPSPALGRSGSDGWSPACASSSGNTASASASHRRSGRWPRSEQRRSASRAIRRAARPAAARLAGGRLRAGRRPRGLAAAGAAARCRPAPSVASSLAPTVLWRLGLAVVVLGLGGRHGRVPARGPGLAPAALAVAAGHRPVGRSSRSSSGRWRCGSGRSSRSRSSARSAMRSHRRASR